MPDYQTKTGLLREAGFYFVSFSMNLQVILDKQRNFLYYIGTG